MLGKQSTLSCKVCYKSLYTALEKTMGICRSCRFSGLGSKCVKCGGTLVTSLEKSSRICKRCQTHDRVCLRCGSALYGPREKQEGLCSRCKRRYHFLSL